MAIADREVETARSLSEYSALPARARGIYPTEDRIPNGPAAAAILAAGIGSALYGLIVLLAESSEAFRQLMVLNSSVGPLSGKSTFGVLAWLAAWAGLHFAWRDRDVNFGRAWAVTLALVGIALVLTFPLFFGLFAAE